MHKVQNETANRVQSEPETAASHTTPVNTVLLAVLIHVPAC